MHGRKVIVFRLLDVLPGTVKAPFMATTFAGLCSVPNSCLFLLCSKLRMEATSKCKSLKYALTTVRFMALRWMSGR